MSRPPPLLVVVIGTGLLGSAAGSTAVSVNISTTADPDLTAGPDLSSDLSTSLDIFNASNPGLPAGTNLSSDLNITSSDLIVTSLDLTTNLDIFTTPDPGLPDGPNLSSDFNTPISDFSTTSLNLSTTVWDLNTTSSDLNTNSSDLDNSQSYVSDSPDITSSSSEVSSRNPDVAVTSPGTMFMDILVDACLAGADQSISEQLRNGRKRSAEKIKAMMHEASVELTKGQQRLKQQMDVLQAQHQRQMTALMAHHQEQLTELKDQLASDHRQRLTTLEDLLSADFRRLQQQMADLQSDVTGPAPAEVCPAGWSLRGDSCYLIPAEEATWYTAQRACPVFDSRAQLASVHRNNSGHATALVSASGDSHWMGLFQRAGGSERWSWTDGSPLDFTNWRQGEPNNGGLIGGDENCALMFESGAWNDEECSYSEKYICQITLR